MSDNEEIKEKIKEEDESIVDFDSQDIIDDHDSDPYKVKATLEGLGVPVLPMIYGDEDPEHEVEFQINSMMSMDELEETPFYYDKVYAKIRVFSGDNIDDLKRFAFRQVRVLHFLMDMIRLYRGFVSVGKTYNYVDKMSKTHRETLVRFSETKMPKKHGKARIIVSARYGFPVGERGESFKITLYEYSDAVESFQFAMEMLEPLAAVSEKLKRHQDTYHMIPKEGGKQKSIIEAGDELADANSLMPPGTKFVISTSTNINTTQPYVECYGDDIAHSQPNGTRVRYYATRVKFNATSRSKVWNFYGPPSSQWKRYQNGEREALLQLNISEVEGIYVYPNSDTTFFERAQREGLLPPAPVSGEIATWYCIVDAIKSVTKSGDKVKWTIVSIAIVNQPNAES